MLSVCSSSNSMREPLLSHHGGGDSSRETAERSSVERKRPRGVKKQSNRLLASRLRSSSSHLVQNFSDFLATSRNVINKESNYDKIVNSRQHRQHHQYHHQPIKTAAHSRHSHHHHHHQHQYHHHQQQQAHNHKRSRVAHLLSALLSRHQQNKASLLVSLLRAPIVLAALFSLLLVASLMVLYAISFYHHLEVAREAEARGHAHRISSRQLAAALGHRSESREGDDFERALTVQTECGRWVGAPEGRAIAFRGIPYASPPVAERRWTRPRPIWLDGHLCQANSTNEARDWRRHCAQLSPVTRRFSGHEDCLYLDIYTPQLNQVKKLPVMVYIHGGFLTFGSSGQGQVNWLKGHPSAALASELNVVLVAFNYRLQALGFITLVQLAQNNGPDGSEGNYGLWDQLAALNWIKRNIESFSGDPNNIVLFGPDSASALPLALMSRRSSSSSGSGDSASTTDIRSKQTTGSESIASVQSVRDLFRAVWLTNPTVYYELPYEAASRHYERLFLGQSSCLRANATSASTTTSATTTTTDRDQSEQTLRCLMSLSAEQVVRQYLGKDDPSYRLDDQNSLPIHGIFADQFVTVDQELVQDSFPFTATTTTNNSPEATAPTLVAAIAAANETNSTSHYKPPQQQLAADQVAANCFATNCHAKDLLLGSTAQAVEYWPCPRNLHQWKWENFTRYVDTSLNSFITDTYKRASELYAVPSSATFTTELQSNSSSGTEANDEIVAHQQEREQHQRQPAEVYLSMVSDIRQTCPINELASSMANRHHRVQRYIVETQPSSWQHRHQDAVDDADESDDAAALFDQAHHKPRYAYHTWDLFAFFGFEFEPDFKPTQRDLQFQAQIRQMVKSFVHKHSSAHYRDVGGGGLGDSDDGDSGFGNRQGLYTLFGRDGTARQVSDYKVEECGMWRKHLDRSYAWIS